MGESETVPGGNTTNRCPYCGSDHIRPSGSGPGRLLRRLVGRLRFRCRHCGVAWVRGPGGPVRSRSGRRRGFLRRHPILATVGLVVLVLGTTYLLLALFGVVPGVADYLSNEKMITGNSGKKYTIGGAIERAREKRREREKDKSE